MIIGIDHGYFAIKTRHFKFPAGVAVYSHEPYTLKTLYKSMANTMFAVPVGSLFFVIRPSMTITTS